MSDFRIGYLYSLAPIHCGGEGDLGNILEIAREVHTNFPYLPGSSLRGKIRDEVENISLPTANRLFGKELDSQGNMGVHQVWFGDARLLWIPMRTMSHQNRDVFTWVTCHSLIRDHALIADLQQTVFPSHPVGTTTGTYYVADAQVNVSPLSNEQREAIALSAKCSQDLGDTVQQTWENSRLVLPDADFQILMEHSLWTQVRNKIQAEGSAEVFWTDVCIPRDTILYYSWGYRPLKQDPLTEFDHVTLTDVIQGLIQVGGQANVGRGWVQSWVANTTSPVNQETATVGG